MQESTVQSQHREAPSASPEGRRANTVEFPGPDSQEQLVRRAIQGDRDALQRLCHSIARGVLFRTQRILDNRLDAEDAAQEVLLKVCTKIGDLKNPKAFNGWLNSILIHETRQMMIKNSKQGTVLSVAEYLESIEEEDEDFLPAEYILREEERAIIIAILDRLSVRQKEAVLLHYFDGLSVTETAEAMGITQQGASRYLKLAREKVKDELAAGLGLPKAAASRLSALPTAALLSTALKAEASLTLPADGIWVTQAMETCAQFFKPSFSWSSIAKPVAATAAAAAVMAALLFGSTLGKSESVTVPPEQVPQAAEPSATHIVGLIDFYSSASRPDVNPSYAEAIASTEFGEMKPVCWWITTAEFGASLDSDQLSDLDQWLAGLPGQAGVLSSGQGGALSEPLVSMQAAGQQGEYMLIFLMEDGAGQSYLLKRGFTIEVEP